MDMDTPYTICEDKFSDINMSAEKKRTR
jgi:hypothetical protein